MAFDISDDSSTEKGRFFRKLFEYGAYCAEALSIKRNETASFFAALTLVAVAKIQPALNIGYAIDDYHQILHGLDSIRDSIIRQGRIGAYWLSELFSYFGVELARAPLLAILASIFLSTWVANAVLRLWRVDLPHVTRALCIFVIAAHPYTAEILTFRGIAIYHVIALTLAFAALTMARAGLAGILIPSLVLSAALTIYQVPVSYIAIFLCIDAALRTLRYLLSGSEAKFTEHVFDEMMIARIKVVVLGIVLYAVWLKLSTWGLPPHPRSVPIAITDISGRVFVGFGLIWAHFVSGGAYVNDLVPVPVLAILLILIALAAVGFALRVAEPWRAILGIAIILIAPVLAAYAMLGLPLLAKWGTFPPRVLSQIGLVWAGVAVMAFFVSRASMRRIVTGLLGIVTLVFIALNQQMFVDQARVNIRDHNMALLILSRLELQPDFAQVRRIAVVGSRADVEPVPTAIHPSIGFNNSSFSGWWAVAPMLTELTGIGLKPANAAERASAAVHCKERASWPALESVSIVDDLALVCL